MHSLRSRFVLLVLAVILLGQGGVLVAVYMTADDTAATAPLDAAAQPDIGAATAVVPPVGVIVAIGLVTLALGLGGAMLLVGDLRRRLDGIAAAARRIATGDYAQRLPADAVCETNALTAAINDMQAEIATRENEITCQAHFDRLTGLPNRFQAEQRLAALLEDLEETEVPVTVMSVDLNRFSDVGISFGHDIGDALLAQAAERLRATVDARHALARLDGDEFLIVMEGVAPEGAWETAEDILRLLGAGLSVGDINVSVDASIGICGFPEHGTTADELLMHAGVARNDAREAPESINIYRAGKEERYVRQLAILGDLRRGIREHELKLYMQPKVLLSDGSVCGAEALVRWDHPTLGFLPPDEFIHIAQRSGNIPLITQWALETAVRECRLWLEEGLDLPVSVNLTGDDLLDPKLPVHILETLRNHDLDPRYLTLEITENSLLRDFDYATVVLQCLRDLGTHIAIDDFGTGHSSLEWIKSLPVDELKIDRSFVNGLPDDRKDIAIVRATIELAHSMGLSVIAEGVESQLAVATGLRESPGILHQPADAGRSVQPVGRPLR
ncbi:MAG: putative bifunctional diguanylate cyclase/phosphodiesterase [Woeseiaceae bacterium]